MRDPVVPLVEAQSAAAVLMVRPACFAFNPETAASNAFQSGADRGVPLEGDIQALALREFDELAGLLERWGIEVIIGVDTPLPVKPDAVFPNNWVSFHNDGTVVLYPMLAPNRRAERRDALLREVVERGFSISRTVDLTARESEGRFLEGTGSLVLDRAHRVAYAALSPRTDPALLADFAERLGYRPMAFAATDSHVAIYHTNVLMAVGSRFAVICAEAIDEAARPRVLAALRAGGHELLEISRPQMRNFAGNVLELAAPGGPLVALSQTAWQSLGAAQRRFLEAHAGIAPAAIPVIERLGGGGVRCMLAEVHLPKSRPMR